MKKFNEMSKTRKVITIVFAVFIGLCIIGSLSDNSSSTTQEKPSETTNTVETTNNETINNEEVKNQKDKKVTEWNGHDLGKNKFVLSNDEYCFVIKKIDKVEDTIRLTYTFINESGDDSSAIWNFQCVPYQNGISLNDSKDYQSHYYKCGNEQTSVRSGKSIDGCWDLIPIGDGSEIECDMGAGMWNESHLFKINPDTMKWSIEEK